MALSAEEKERLDAKIRLDTAWRNMSSEDRA
jgi:hypothetical protein